MSRKEQGTIRMYEAPTIFEAYTRLKQDLGESAVIISTRTIKKGGILGFWGQKVVQITASEKTRHAPKRIIKQDQKDISTAQLLKRAYSNPQAVATKPLPTKPLPKKEKELKPIANNQSSNGTIALHNSKNTAADLKEEITEIRNMIQEIQSAGRYRHWPDLPPEFQKAYEKLQSLNIQEDISRALIHRWRNHYPDFKKGDRVDIKLLEQYIEDMLVPAGPIVLNKNKPTTVMLIGPTGVGKTTSIAKLAATQKIREEKNVALITVDTYRIAAVEQLRTYADLIGVPIKVVSSSNDLKSAIESFNDKDLILIDSAGRSPRNKEKMQELHSYVKAAEVDELHLVLSTSVNNDVIEDTMDRFNNFPINKLLLTKLDEAVHFGMILSIISKTQKPIGYITTGQEVPDDIEVATGKRLARIILSLDKFNG
jgi:flagellar biosynthesis protein FlhF